MHRFRFSPFYILLAALTCAASAHSQRQMENLSRGIVAVKQGARGVFVGWRQFATDPEEIAFNVYRMTGNQLPIRVNRAPIHHTSFIDYQADLTQPLHYYVRPVLGKREYPFSSAAKAWETNYIDIPIQPIPDYRPGDADITVDP